MPLKLNLAAKVMALVAGVLALAVFSTGVALYSASRLTGLMRGVVAENLASVRAAEGLRTAEEGFGHAAAKLRSRPDARPRRWPIRASYRRCT
jgi:hypothetical protein